MLISLFLVFLLHLLFVPCGRLSWLTVSFLLHIKYTVSYPMTDDERSLLVRGTIQQWGTLHTMPPFQKLRRSPRVAPLAVGLLC